MVKARKKEIFKKVSLDLIDRPEEIARMEIDEQELGELAASIDSRGLIQPIGVAPQGERYLIVFGDRRYLAHKMLKKKDIMCRIEEISYKQIIMDRCIENVHRVNLTPFEEGHNYAKMAEELGMSLAEISKEVDKSPGVVQRRIDIMRMPESFQKALQKKYISISVAEELWSCPDEARREYFLVMAVEHGITQAVARTWVDEHKKNLRGASTGAEEGGGVPAAFESAPIYRACDTCKGPVDYADLKELRICNECFNSITKAVVDSK